MPDECHHHSSRVGGGIVEKFVRRLRRDPGSLSIKHFIPDLERERNLRFFTPTRLQNIEEKGLSELHTIGVSGGYSRQMLAIYAHIRFWKEVVCRGNISVRPKPIGPKTSSQLRHGGQCK